MIFLQKYNIDKNIRFKSFFKTLEIAKNKNLKLIVETGTTRGKTKFFFFNKYNWKDGMSSIMFAEYAKSFNGHLHTCDISKKNIDLCKKFTKKFSKYITYYVDDSVNFLKLFKFKIDILYLDSLDSHDPESASKHQLNEIVNSIDKLNNNSLVLLDDKGGKTKLSLDFLLKNGFQIILETKYQLLLTRI